MGEKFSSALGQLCSSALPCQKKKDGTFVPPFCCQLSTRSLRLEVLCRHFLEILCHAHAQIHVGLIEALRHRDDALDGRSVVGDNLVHIDNEVLVDLRGELQPVEAIVDLVRDRPVTLDLVLDLLCLAAECGDDLLESADFVDVERDSDFHDIVLL